MRCRALSLLASSAVATSACVTADPAARTPPFEAAVERHLAAVGARDYEALVPTVTEEERLLLIFPNGHVTHSRAEFLSFHREWFADPNWTMKFEKIGTYYIEGYGRALYRTTYDGDGSGPEEPRSSYLSLGFRLEKGQWRLVDDQNTRIATAL